MAKPKQIILTEEGVITQEALLAYAEGRLGAAESAQLEKLLADVRGRMAEVAMTAPDREARR